jgi:LDH2 family malate/lactate/ureidoglycolate dehydrogenase
MADVLAPRNATVELDPAQAHELVTTALLARGVLAGAARDVADSLVGAEVAGKPSHGLRLLPGYLADYDEGRLDPRAGPHVEQHSAHVVVRGARVAGSHLASAALMLAAEQARRGGWGAAAMPDLAHCGRLGGYVAAVAARGQIAMMTVGSLGTPDGFVGPPGGTGRRLDTNPVAFAFPAAAGPVVIDLATSAVTYNQVVARHEAGGELEPDVACDAAGRPTREPAKVLDGGWALPFGGAKGFALGLLAPLFAALVPGGARPGLSGGYAIVLDVASQTDVDGYRADVQQALDHLVREAGQVRVPGQSRRERIRISAPLLATIRTATEVPA